MLRRRGAMTRSTVTATIVPAARGPRSHPTPHVTDRAGNVPVDDVVKVRGLATDPDSIAFRTVAGVDVAGVAGVDVAVSHNCARCGATLEMCDQHLREDGRACCSSCISADTHGLLRSLSADSTELGRRVTNVEKETDEHTKLLAQMVIFRTEAAKAIRQLRAAEQRHDEETALLRGRVEGLERLAHHHLGALRRILEEFEQRLVHLDQHQAAFDDMALQDRVYILELCLDEIEKKLKLRRRTTPPDDEEPEP
jgi:hypothetical protein